MKTIVSVKRDTQEHIVDSVSGVFYSVKNAKLNHKGTNKSMVMMDCWVTAVEFFNLARDFVDGCQQNSFWREQLK